MYRASLDRLVRQTVCEPDVGIIAHVSAFAVLLWRQPSLSCYEVHT